MLNGVLMEQKFALHMETGMLLLEGLMVVEDGEEI